MWTWLDVLSALCWVLVIYGLITMKRMSRKGWIGGMIFWTHLTIGFLFASIVFMTIKLVLYV